MAGRLHLRHQQVQNAEVEGIEARQKWRQERIEELVTEDRPELEGVGVSLTLSLLSAPQRV